MTKSTITRDELNEVIATYGKHHIAHRMANVLLAGMNSEPDCKERKLFCSTDTARMRKVISVSAGTEDAPLYRHAQPAPASMKDHQIRELVNELRDIAIEHHGTQQLRERIARTVRAAMLAAAPQEDKP